MEGEGKEGEKGRESGDERMTCIGGGMVMRGRVKDLGKRRRSKEDKESKKQTEGVEDAEWSRKEERMEAGSGGMEGMKGKKGEGWRIAMGERGNSKREGSGGAS